MNPQNQQDRQKKAIRSIRVSREAVTARRASKYGQKVGQSRRDGIEKKREDAQQLKNIIDKIHKCLDVSFPAPGERVLFSNAGGEEVGVVTVCGPNEDGVMGCQVMVDEDEVSLSVDQIISVVPKEGAGVQVTDAEGNKGPTGVVRACGKNDEGIIGCTVDGTGQELDFFPFDQILPLPDGEVVAGAAEAPESKEADKDDPMGGGKRKKRKTRKRLKKRTCRRRNKGKTKKRHNRKKRTRRRKR